MPTYYSNRVRPDGRQSIKKDSGLTVDYAIVNIATALVNSDVVKLFTVPKNAEILGFMIQGHGVQSGTDSQFKLGDADDDDRFGAGLTNLRTNYSATIMAGPHSATGATGFGYKYTADTDIELIITAAGTGMATGGTIKAAVFYYINE
jgi:hypothetical protein